MMSRPNIMMQKFSWLSFILWFNTHILYCDSIKTETILVLIDSVLDISTSGDEGPAKTVYWNASCRPLPLVIFLLGSYFARIGSFRVAFPSRGMDCLFPSRNVSFPFGFFASTKTVWEIFADDQNLISLVQYCKLGKFPSEVGTLLHYELVGIINRLGEFPSWWVNLNSQTGDVSRLAMVHVCRRRNKFMYAPNKAGAQGGGTPASWY